MFVTRPMPQLNPGAPLLGGWVVGSALPLVDGLWRGRAERAGGRVAVLEAGTYDGASLHRFLDTFVEEIELWGDTGVFLPILAGGRIADSKVVVRVVAAPKGQSLTSFRGRPMRIVRVVNTAAAIASALAAAHARGLTHGALVAERVHLLPSSVEIEPGGFWGALQTGEKEASRPDDVKALAELIVDMLRGGPDGVEPAGIPEALDVLLHNALNPSPNERPTAVEMVSVLRQVGAERTPLSASEVTPASVSRTVAPRLGVVDVTLPPAAPPAPELRSLVPAQERVKLPTVQKEKVTRTAEMTVAFGVLVLSAVVLWWMLG